MYQHVKPKCILGKVLVNSGTFYCIILENVIGLEQKNLLGFKEHDYLC